MTKVFRLEDGTRFVADVRKDTALYQAPENPPNTGSRYTAGTNLYVHETKSHGNQFYKYRWSMWQGSESVYEYVTKEQAIEFLESVCGDYNGFPDSADTSMLKEYGIDLLEETA
jgi:hypothetical protein